MRGFPWMTWIDRLLPRACALCGLALAPGGRIGLCSPCLEDLTGARRPRCPRCALSLGPRVCPCSARFSGLIDRTIAAADYAPALDHLITAMKFGRQVALARVLGELVGMAWKGHEPHPPIDLLIPMPVSSERLAQRGFNQALEMARGCVGFLPRPVRLLPDTLRRIRHTPAQSGLGRTERLHNLQDTLACRPLLGPARVGLIDDVMTTGATALAAARCLRAAGARQVIVLVAARAAPPADYTGPS
jgi:ComF family protein